MCCMCRRGVVAEGAWRLSHTCFGGMHRVQRAMAQRPSNQTSSDPTPGAMEHSHTKASEQFSSSLKLLMQMLQSSNNDAVMHRHALAGGVTSGAQSVEGGPCGSTGSLSGAFASIPSAKASEGVAYLPLSF